MLNIVYGDSITDDEFEFEETDILHDKESPFSKVILNENNLKLWLEFCRKTGQEQEDFLDNLKPQDTNEKKHARYKQRLNDSLNSTGSSDYDFENGNLINQFSI
jgi:hypothetical protein